MGKVRLTEEERKLLVKFNLDLMLDELRESQQAGGGTDWYLVDIYNRQIKQIIRDQLKDEEVM